MTLDIIKRAKLQDELCNSENWAPKLSRISKKTGIPVATIFDNFHKLRKEKRIMIGIRIMTESEAFAIKNINEMIDNERRIKKNE